MVLIRSLLDQVGRPVCRIWQKFRKVEGAKKSQIVKLGN